MATHEQIVESGNYNDEIAGAFAALIEKFKATQTY
jgi:hypothetical protein